MEKIIFYILAVSILALSLLSVLSRRLLRSAVYLFGVLSAVAGFYFLIGYHFLGAVQLTVYAGGIVVLIIFSILLTHEIDHKMERPGWLRAGAAGALCLAGAAMVIQLLSANPWARVEAAERSDLDTLGVLLLTPGEGGYLLPFELISILLLAAIIGAVVIAKHHLGGSRENQENQPL
ncbi:MAG: NADH-quinone oxidoreductase subunit J [Saprospirales bacterium]|nr:NADH-quinone oxidoreductase subunit J [Saprospirales bacterium]MBK8920209.1 NADH-quinone oxidoreductase subunit J [Saprospirales bacterium]